MKLRPAIRDIVVRIASIVTSPLWIAVRLSARVDRRDNLFLACSQFLSLFPGLPGIFLRRGFYRMCADDVALDCTIEFGTWLAHRRVEIGRRVYIGGRCTIAACSIGEDTLIGSNVDLVAGRHTHRFDDAERPICDQPVEFRQIRIGRNVWIGNSAVVMNDVGDGAVIGAGSVVVKPIPAGTVAAGNPCTVKKTCRTASSRDLAEPCHF